MLLIDARCADVIRLRARRTVQLTELSIMRHGVLYGLEYVQSASFTMASYGFGAYIKVTRSRVARTFFPHLRSDLERYSPPSFNLGMVHHRLPPVAFFPQCSSRFSN